MNQSKTSMDEQMNKLRGKLQMQNKTGTVTCNRGHIYGFCGGNISTATFEEICETWYYLSSILIASNVAELYF